MKVFWSWQSDTPGKIGRHFVRDALLGAIQNLKAAPDIEEPTKGHDREAFHLDSDRQGVPGSPDLAATIFAKIDIAAVVVADVTPIGRGPDRKDKDGNIVPPKALMNPNVAIELGYALGKHANGHTNNIIMVCNEHYGVRADLPFDLAHKAGPIFYRLAPNAQNDEITKVQKELRRELTTALKLFLAVPVPVPQPFVPTPAGAHAGVYFSKCDILGESGHPKYGNIIQYRMETDPVFYLRVIPFQNFPEKLTRSALGQIASKVPFFSSTGGTHICGNAWGVANVEPGVDGFCQSIVQIFPNGELWAVNRSLFEYYPDHSLLAIGAVEMLLRRRLSDYIDVLLKKLGLQLPIAIEIGFHGVERRRLVLNHSYTTGPIYQEPKSIRLQLNADGSEQRNALLLTLFERMFLELVGDGRPDNYNGFPDPNRPASYPERRR